MEVRTPWMPDDHEPDDREPDDRRADSGAAPTELRWRVNRRLTVLKAAVAVVFLLVALLFRADPVGFGVALLAALALGAFALRDLLLPIRLAVDPTGVTVPSGFTGTRHLPWERIERIRVDERRRFGTRSELLEIDTGDSLHLFSGYELSASCAEVADLLCKLRSQAARTR
ncbi:PH domain-containing protein [Planosporangium sp. 12N6]|uniref:PH domain-containing protein n=1 Tax=Planosporangium spinosum TaxID=3402278 RepID=UPI003CEEF4B8